MPTYSSRKIQYILWKILVFDS